MYLLIDGQALQTPDSRGRGIGRYARNLSAALAAARPEWRIEVVQNDTLPTIDPAGVGARPLLHFQPPFPPDRAHREANEQYYAHWLTARRPDAILILSCFERYALIPAFSGPRPKLHAVAYDLIPLVFHDRYLNDPFSRAEYAYRLRQFLCFDGLLAISQATVADLQHLLEEDCPRVVNIGGAPDPTFTAAADDACADVDSIRRRYGLKDDFLLFVGGCDFRKNMRGAIAAFAALPAEVRARTDLAIVCAMNAEEKRSLGQHADSLGCGASIKLLGFVRDDELRQLYHSCRLYFFPSLYEGLGLPVLEALQCGAPVVTSDRSALPEYAGPHSWLTNPECPRSMAETLQRALAEPRDAHRGERISFARSFTWQKTAERACAFLERSVARVQRRRRRIAWVSPLPPTPSGIADYSAELLAVLGDSFDIELVVDDAAPPVTSKLASAHTIITASELKARHTARPFDLFVYHVGNSDFHVYMLDLMRQFPGLVVLHDFHLGGLQLMAARRGQGRAEFIQALLAEGEDQVAEWLREKMIPDSVAKEMAPLNHRILHQAQALVVHSRYAWQRVRPLVSVPVAFIPHHGFTPPPLGTRAEERARLGLDEEAFIVCTLGIVGYPKRIPSLVRAVVSLPERIRSRLHLFIVGGLLSPRMKQELALEMERAGMAHNLHHVGHVALRDFWSYARAADVCVQLRYPSRGESSGAVLRAMRAGAACLVSNQGAMAEFPAEVAWPIRSPHHEVEDVAAALQRLHDHPHEKDALGRAALRFIQEQRNLETIAAQYAAFFDLTLATNRCPQRSLPQAA